MSEAILASLGQLYPPDRLLTRPAELIPFESDALTAYRARPLAVVLAETQQEVIETVRLCNRFGVPFVPRGSGTSLSGGSLPLKDGIVLALNRLNQILHVDADTRTAVIEPGVINNSITAAASPHNLYFAPDPSSQPICTIGGNVAYNSGGAHCLKYGMTSNHVLAIKAVLGDGEVVTLGGASLEGIGPDLTGLFVGSEGIFGIALEITVRLLPAVATFRTVLAAYHDLQAAGNAVALVVASGLLPGAMEIMDRLAIKAAEASVKAGYPQDAAALLIVELEGEPNQVEVEFDRLLEVIDRSGAAEVRTARDDRERARIWKGRKGAFSAVGRLSPDYLVQDGVVPRGKLATALAEIERLSLAYDLPVANVFHAGDGNLHPLILYDGRLPGALERAKAMAGKILRLCIDLGGSITGEHGVGVEKLAYLPAMVGQADMCLMQNLRLAMDPRQLANRGKMLAVNGPATSAIPTSRTEGGIAQAPPAAFSPATVAQLQQIIRSHRAILVKGAGSKPALSTPGDDLTTVIDMSSMSGILDYEPDEYTITALAGTPVAEITQLLAQHGQYLPFDPPLARAGATLAGTAAAGISGSNRYRYGGARDFILGIRFVDGQGNLLQGGGRVVKNAAGFDLPKLMVGSLGRLGILTELTFKVFPKPEAFATLSVEFKAVDTARRAMIDLSRASLDLEALDLQPTDHGARLWIRISGLAQLLDARLDRLQALVGDGQILTGAGDERYWQSVSEFQWAPWDSALIKIPLTTGQIPAVEALLRPQNAPRRYAVGGNVLWLTLPDLPSSLAESLSHLEMAGLVLRGAPGQPCIGTPPGADFARRVKQVLDPDQRFLEL